MARLSTSEFVDMLRDMLGGENEQTLSNTRLIRWLNQSYLEVVAMTRPQLLSGSETVTTVSGTAEYTFSEDNVLTIDDCIDTTVHQPLYPISEHQYNQFNLGGSTTGTPSYYYNSGVDSNGLFKVTLWPTPNAVHSVVFNITKKPKALVSDVVGYDPTTVISEVWDDSILYRAAARGWISLGDFTAAKEIRAAVKDNDAAAWRATNMLSELGSSLTSQVGAALNGK